MDDFLEPAKVYREFEKQVKRLNTWPITLDNINIQEDAFNRLADGSRYDDYPFAILECSRKNKDSDLRFALEIYSDHFLLLIEGASVMGGDLSAEVFKDEETAGRQLFQVATMLANGQLSILVSERNGKWCASELLLQNTKRKRLQVVSMETHFRWWWRKHEDVTAYECQLLKNSFTTKKVILSDDFFMFEADSQGLKKIGRELEKGDISPLTKSEYIILDEELLLTRAGMQSGGSGEIYKQIELYLVGVVLGSALFYFYKIGLMPHYLHERPWLSLLIVFYVLASLSITIKVLEFKENMRRKYPDHILFKISNGIKQYFFRVFCGAIVAMTVLVSFVPNVVDKKSHELTTIIEISSQYPLGFVSNTLILMGFLVVFGKRVSVRLLGCVLYLIGNVGLWVVNSYTDTEAPVPDEYLIFTLFVLPVGFILMFIYSFLLIVRLFKNIKAPSR